MPFLGSWIQTQGQPPHPPKKPSSPIQYTPSSSGAPTPHPGYCRCGAGADVQGGTEDAEGPLGRTVYYDTTAVIIVFYAFPYEITHSDSGEEFK